MGRQKNIPQKCKNVGENWSLTDNGFIPVFKRRKIRKRAKSYSVHIINPNDKNKQFYLGNHLIGTSNNVLPNDYNKCKLNFNLPIGEDDDEDDDADSIVIEYDDSSIVLVKLCIDIDLLKEICVTKVFALSFETRNKEVYMNVYFVTLPLVKFYTRLGNSIKNVFKLMFNIEMDTAKEISSQCDKNLHGNSEIFSLYKKVSATRENKFKLSDDENMQHPCLRPVLRPYQKEAVKWMLHRERITTDSGNDVLHPLYTTLVLKSGLTIYYDKYTGYVELTKPVVSPCSKGGILADEMGLGKTVEVLACILLNPKPSEMAEKRAMLAGEKLNRPPIVDRQKTKRKFEEEYKNDTVQIKPKKSRIRDEFVKSSSKKTPTRIALEIWYNSILTSTKASNHCSREDDEPLVQCICGNTNEEGIIECDSCGKYQHRSCLGYNRNLGRYLCPQCWMDEPLLECGGTLIVTPVALRTQWCNEICRHLKGGLRVLQYEGYSATPVYPTQLKDYDLVITTYSVLKTELRMTRTGLLVNLRRERKYSPPGSPLVRVKWWRLCLDEAQTVETPGRMVSEMATKISANFRWAITGTPISKNISDLYGLIDYLQITPYNDNTTWKSILYDPYVRGDEKPMLNFLSEVLWRTSKIDVLDQINIPKQTYKEHFLEFSAVEKYFYKREHELSSSDFLFRVRNIDLTLLLGKMDRSTLKKILAPLLSLRHTCTHPNTLRGRYLATKKQVTSMKDLLDALILKNTSDSEECLRLIISSLNGLAGIQLLSQMPQEAISHYREVLQLSARFSENDTEAKLTVDKLQVIHTMHNLAEVLDAHAPSQPTLRDTTLRRDCSELEQKYIEKFMNETITAYECSNAATTHVENLQQKFVLKQGQWYSDGLDWIFINNHYGELLERIQNACDNANVESHLRNSSERNVLKIIYSWDEEIWHFRSKLFDSVTKLYEHQPKGNNKIIIRNDLVEKAMNCHLRPQKKAKNVTRCPVCVSNVDLKRYEGKLFHMTQRKKAFEEMSLVGSWKPTFEEVIFRALQAVLKARNGDARIIKDGEVFITLIESLKKEFKEIRKLWTFLDRQICAQDELDICKVRLQLKDPNSVSEEKKTTKLMKSLTYNLENKNETVNLISVHELDYQHSMLKSEVKVNMKKLEKYLGTQSYLETLRKQQYEGQSPDPCPICKNTLEQHWSILLCGHSYCLECIQVLLEQTVGEQIQCSVCRNKQKYQEISYIKAGNTVTNEDCTKIRGNYSTKIEAVIKLIMSLKKQDPSVKVLLFSSWITVLKCLKEALETNSITCELAFNTNLEARIENFKNCKKNITAFLLPIALGSKGLNLIEATHVILVEPLLNPADELQAVGRVHRIGQKKPTMVHKFLIKNTIEESIYQATTSNADNWDKNKVTLQQLTDLFRNDLSQEIEDAETSLGILNSDSTNEASSSTA